MKLISNLMLIAFTFWAIDPSGSLRAWADTTTYTSTSTSTTTSSSTSTHTDCTTSGQTYGGGSFRYCNKDSTTQQQNSQQQTQDLNNQGAQQSQMLGMMAIAAGIAMVIAGMSQDPPNGAMIAAGMMLIMQGMQALQAAAEMNKNANIADYRGSDMTGLNSGPTTSTTGNGTSSGIKIDPSLLHDGKANSIMTDFENKTGLSREALADSLANGGNPLDMISGAPALAGNPNASAGNLAKLLDDAKSSQGANTDPNSLMDKLGLTADDLGGKGDYSANYGSGGRNPSSAGASTGFDFAGGMDKGGPSGGNSVNTALGVSKDVQAALNRNGFSDLTIFQMVHVQYKKKTPQMFGVQQKRDGANANPFANE